MMKRKHIVKASIWCILTIIGTDLLSYWKRGKVVFIDTKAFSNPILAIVFILILSLMIYGFAKYLSHQEN